MVLFGCVAENFYLEWVIFEFVITNQNLIYFVYQKFLKIKYWTVAPHKVIALNLFFFFFTSSIYIDSNPLFYIASHVVIALSTIAKAIVTALKDDSKK